MKSLRWRPFWILLNTKSPQGCQSGTRQIIDPRKPKKKMYNPQYHVQSKYVIWLLDYWIRFATVSDCAVIEKMIAFLCDSSNPYWCCGFFFMELFITCVTSTFYPE